MTQPAEAQPEPGSLPITDIVAYPGGWRAGAAAMRAVSRGTLVVTVLLFLVSDDPPTNPLMQLRIFFGLIAAPEMAAWCIARAFSATMRVAGGVLVLEQREARTEIPATAISAVELWWLPLPRPGLWLRLRSGRRYTHALDVPDPDRLVDALVAAGGPESLRGGRETPRAVFAAARRAHRRRWVDRPLFQFVVYALVPAVPAFRLHQIITYGGGLGEYYTFGLEAYLLGFGLWWSSWAFYLLLVATVLRTVVEAGCAAAAVVAPRRANGTRTALEWVRRVVYFGGIPAFLVLRLWPW